MSSASTSELESFPDGRKTDADHADETVMAVPEHGIGPTSPSPSPSPTASRKEQLEDIKAAEEFKPTLRFKLAFVSLAILTLMVALDATSISVALPVCNQNTSFSREGARELR